MIKVQATCSHDGTWWFVRREHTDYRFRSLRDAVAFVRAMAPTGGKGRRAPFADREAA